MKNKVDVRIGGKDYTIVSNDSDEYMQRVGLYVDKKITEIMKSNNKLSTSMAAVLTALNVADDFFKIRENDASLRSEYEKLKKELETLREDRESATAEIARLSSRNTELMIELAKREAELNEVRNSTSDKQGGIYRRQWQEKDI